MRSKQGDSEYEQFIHLYKIGDILIIQNPPLIIISLDYYIDFSSKKIMDGRKMCLYDEKCTPSLTRLALLP